MYWYGWTMDVSQRTRVVPPSNIMCVGNGDRGCDHNNDGGCTRNIVNVYISLSGALHICR